MKMKKLILIALAGFISASAFAQNVDMRRKITVSGTAEKEVTPDIINVSISLQEYFEGKKKINIEQLQSTLEDAVKQAGIPKADFTINNIAGWNNQWQKKKNPDFLESRQYNIRLHDLSRIDQVLASLDPKGVQQTGIASYDYSKMPEIKQEMKIQALLAAKEKATYLLNSIGEKLGRPIDINDSDNSEIQQYQPSYANRVVSREIRIGETDIDIKPIKLSFQVQVVFEITP